MKVANRLLVLLCLFALTSPDNTATATSLVNKGTDGNAGNTAIGFNCKDVIKSQLHSQIQTAAVFSNSDPLFVVSICKSDNDNINLPILAHLYGRMLSPEEIQNSTPVVSLTNLSTLINPNLNADGESRATGILSVDPSNMDKYTVSLRVRFSSGQAIDIRKTTELLRGQSFLFEHEGISLGFARLPQQREDRGIGSKSATMDNN
jgi:hypothetical protein